MTNENEGTAQPADPAVPGEGNGVSEGGDGSNATPGVQKRIDQLTAQLHEERRAREEQQKLVQTMMLSQMTERQQVQKAPEPQLPSLPPVPEGVDPGMFNAFVQAAQVTSRREMMELERRMAPLLQQTHRTQAEMTIAQESGGNSELAQRAQRRYNHWLANNLQGDPRDAVLYEEGLMARELRSAKSANRDELGRFNRGAGTMIGAGGPVNGPPPAETPIPSYADQQSDDFDAAKAAAWMRQRMQSASKKK